jgi:monodictyphenone polyketide synthase
LHIGIQAGDSEEMQGILDVYAPVMKRRSKDQPLSIGAVKANIGHCESVAGTTALIKVLLMFQKNAIPPHIGIKTEINPKFPRDFDKRILHIAFAMTTWPQISGTRRLAAINNFGVAGGNTTMMLEEPPSRNVTENDPRQIRVVAVSAKTKGSLVGNIGRLIAYIDAYPYLNLADFSYTTTARRYQHSRRVAVATSAVDHLRKQLASRLEKIDAITPVAKSGSPPIVFIFTGQVASHKSMSLDLYRDVPSFRKQI